MTLNTAIKRLQTLALAHKQLRNFYYGNVTDFLNDKTTRFASCFLQDMPGSIDIASKTRTLNFKVFLLDLVHVSEDAKANEQDVQSDMLGVAEDLIAEINYSAYTDWKLSSGIPQQFVREEDSDLVAGVMIDIAVQTPFTSDVCAVPTESYEFVITEDMKYVYDEAYTATGSEGSSLSIAAIAGKKVLMVTREFAVLHKVSTAPAATEYTWNDTVIGLGIPTIAGERFLILYRNY